MRSVNVIARTREYNTSGFPKAAFDALCGSTAVLHDVRLSDRRQLLVDAEYEWRMIRRFTYCDDSGLMIPMHVGGEKLELLSILLSLTARSFGLTNAQSRSGWPTTKAFRASNEGASHLASVQQHLDCQRTSVLTMAQVQLGCHWIVMTAYKRNTLRAPDEPRIDIERVCLTAKPPHNRGPGLRPTRIILLHMISTLTPEHLKRPA